jgi:hypothetical protein
MIVACIFLFLAAILMGMATFFAIKNRCSLMKGFEIVDAKCVIIWKHLRNKYF